MGKLVATTSEGLVIGSVINHPDYLLELSDLKADFFNDKINQIIYMSIKRLYKNGAKTIDSADIYALIESNDSKKQQLERYGGIDYIEQLRIIGEDKDINDTKLQAQNIIDCSFKNEMADTLSGLHDYISVAKDERRNDINKVIEEKILSVKAKYSSGHKVELINSKTDKIMQLLSEQSGEYMGFDTSIPLLSKFVTYRKGELVIYSAKAKVGKSQLVVNEAYNMAIIQGIPVMILDTELQTRTFFVRLMARITGYSFKFIESGVWKDYPKVVKKIEHAKELIDKAPISHTYIVDWTHEEIYNEVKRMKIQYDIQVLIYDYIKVEEVTTGVQEHQLLGNITNWLKNGVAGELDIAVIALAQMSDYVSEERGFKIANSEKIKNYASTVIYLLEKSREQYANDFDELGGNAYFYVSYNRNGPQMSFDQQDIGVNVSFQKNKALIEQAQWQHEEIEQLANEEEPDDFVVSDGEAEC
jgi:replicative DNA helicase